MRKYTRKKYIKNTIIFIIFFILIAIIMAIYKIYGNIDTYGQNENILKNANTIGMQESKDKSITEILNNVTHTVVGISKIKSNGVTALKTETSTQIGLGSGVVISEKGYILTNEHVSGGKYSTCYVTLENGETLSGNVVWADDRLDLSILKVNQQFVNYAKLGDSENIEIGQTVYAIGNPIGMEFQRTVTSGIISATNRVISFEENQEKVYMDSLIQTDATINPGNSGGPLLNIYGEIIGINTVKITSAEGIGFAVPINIIKPILEKLENTGKFEEISLGIVGYDANVSKYIDFATKIEKGVYVVESKINNEIKSGDNILKIDGKEIKNMNTIREYIYKKQVGEQITLTIKKNNKEYDIKVILNRK